MLSILAIVLGLVIIVSAVAADRSARARRPFRAVLLNLFGIGCLGLGLVSVYAWAQPGVRGHHQHQVAVADSGDRALVVKLVVGHDGRLEHLVTAEAAQDDSGLEAVAETAADAESEAEMEAGAVAETSQEEHAEALAEEPSMSIDLIELGELETLEDDQEEPLDFDPQTARVEIDFDARPEWVDQPDRDLGETHLISVSSGPYKKVRNARKELYKQVKQATDEYIIDVVRHPAAAHWVGYSEDEIRHRFLAPDRLFDEKVISPSFGVMHQSHALLEFGPEFHHEVERAWHQVIARAQLVKVALGGGAVLAMLVMLFGYFNADTATRGFYSGRLKFVTGLAILAVIATGFLIARSIPWLWL